MIGSLQPYCNGLDSSKNIFCPIMLKCCRYKSRIDFMNESYFAYAPYNHVESKCEFFVGDVTDEFLNKIKSLNNGRKKTDNKD